MSNPFQREPDRVVESSPTIRREDYFESPPEASEELPLEREGLPSDYRMRTEEHYVDDLIGGTSMPQFRRVPIDEIESPYAAVDEDIDTLAESIRAHGLLQPLLARRHQGRYELLAGARRLAAARRAGLDQVPCLVHEVDDAEASELTEAARRSASEENARDAYAWAEWSQQASATVQASLSTILSTLGLFDRPDTDLRDRVAISLIRAEASRTSRLLRGLNAMGSAATLSTGSVDLAAVLRSVLAETEEERRLLSIPLVASGPESCPIRGDEAVLRAALAGAVETILALLRTGQPGELTVELTPTDSPAGARLLVAEHDVPALGSSPSRWFDPAWPERPGGFAAAVALLSAKRAAELHGGGLSLSAAGAEGCSLTVTLVATR